MEETIKQKKTANREIFEKKLQKHVIYTKRKKFSQKNNYYPLYSFEPLEPADVKTRYWIFSKTFKHLFRKPLSQKGVFLTNYYIKNAIFKNTITCSEVMTLESKGFFSSNNLQRA